MDRDNWIRIFKLTFRREAGFSFDELGDTGEIDRWRDEFPDVPELAGEMAAADFLWEIEEGDWLALE